MATHHPRRTVVVGVDGSDDALRAVRWAATEADRRGSLLRLVTAIPWTDGQLVGTYRPAEWVLTPSDLLPSVPRVEETQPLLDVELRKRLQRLLRSSR